MEISLRELGRNVIDLLAAEESCQKTQQTRRRIGVLVLDNLDRDAGATAPRPKENTFGVVFVLTKIHCLVLTYSPVGLGMHVRFPGRLLSFGFKRYTEIGCQDLMQRLETGLGDHRLEIFLGLGAGLFEPQGLDFNEKIAERHVSFRRKLVAGSSNRSVRMTARKEG